MDPLSQARFDQLVTQDANTLSEADAEFLRARSTYLSPEQRDQFAAILAGSRAEEEIEEVKPKKSAK